jgi:hypothetical protein
MFFPFLFWVNVPLVHIRGGLNEGGIVLWFLFWEVFMRVIVLNTVKT